MEAKKPFRVTGAMCVGWLEWLAPYGRIDWAIRRRFAKANSPFTVGQRLMVHRGSREGEVARVVALFKRYTPPFTSGAVDIEFDDGTPARYTNGMFEPRNG